MFLAHVRIGAALGVALSVAAAVAPCRAAAQTAASSAAPLTADEARAIRAVGDTLDARWNRRDAAAFGSLFTPDGDLEVIGSEAARRLRGTVPEFYRASFARAQPELRHRTATDELQVIAPGIVLAEGRAWIEREGADGARTPLRAYTTKTLLVRTGDAWRIRVARSHAEALDAAVMRVEQ